MLSKWVDHGTERIKGGVTLEIFMNVDATDQQIEDVDAALDDDPNVKSFRFLDKDAAYEEFKRIFRRNPDLVNSITAADLPPSYRVAPKPRGAHRHGEGRSSRRNRASTPSRRPARR